VNELYNWVSLLQITCCEQALMLLDLCFVQKKYDGSYLCRCSCLMIKNRALYDYECSLHSLLHSWANPI